MKVSIENKQTNTYKCKAIKINPLISAAFYLKNFIKMSGFIQVGFEIDICWCLAYQITCKHLRVHKREISKHLN